LSEQSHKYAKYGVLATLLAAIIGGAITLYTHFDSMGLQVDEIPCSVEQKDTRKRGQVLQCHNQPTITSQALRLRRLKKTGEAYR